MEVLEGFIKPSKSATGTHIRHVNSSQGSESSIGVKVEGVEGAL